MPTTVQNLSGGSERASLLYSGLFYACGLLGVLVSGHTDDVGSEASNLALSNARASAVKQHLVAEEGIDAGRLATKGFGATQPVADNGTDAGRARNRRVDVVITPKGAN